MIKWLSRQLGKIKFKRAIYQNPQSWLQPVSQAGVEVTPHTALNCAAVWAAVNCISNDLASLPLKTYQRQNGAKREADEHALWDLLTVEPNPDMDAYHWEQTMYAHALTWGNAYSELVWDADGEIATIWLLDPATTCPLRDERTQKLWYRVRAPRGWKQVDPENIIHLKGLANDGVIGWSPIELARQNLGLLMGAELYGANVFGNSAVPNGFFKRTGPGMTKEAYEEMRESVNSMHGGVYNAGKIGLLPPGWEFQATQLPPDTVAFLGTREFGVVEVCRWYSLSPIRLQDYSHATYSNVEQANIDHINRCLRPWAECFEAELNRKCLSRAERKTGFFVRHDFAALLRGDIAATTEFLKSMRETGAFSINDIRAYLDLTDIGPEGDLHYVPLNSSPVENKPENKPELPPKPESPPALPGPDVATKAVRDLLTDEVGRMVRREVKALRRASRKPDCRTAIEEFYALHEAVVAETVTPCVRAYSAVLGQPLDSDALIQALTSTSRDKALEASDLEELLAQWEAVKAPALVEGLHPSKEGR